MSPSRPSLRWQRSGPPPCRHPHGRKSSALRSAIGMSLTRGSSVAAGLAVKMIARRLAARCPARGGLPVGSLAARKLGAGGRAMARSAVGGRRVAGCPATGRPVAGNSGPSCRRMTTSVPEPKPPPTIQDRTPVPRARKEATGGPAESWSRSPLPPESKLCVNTLTLGNQPATDIEQNFYLFTGRTERCSRQGERRLAPIARRLAAWARSVSETLTFLMAAGEPFGHR
jgi:hypothetical protein